MGARKMILTTESSLLTSFIESLPGQITLIAGALIVFFLVFFFVQKKTKKYRYLKTIHALEKEVMNIQSIPVSTKLIKIELIGRSNVVFNQVYQEYNTLYEETIAMYANDLKNDFITAKRQINDKTYRKLGDNIKSIIVKINAYKDKMEELYKQLQTITKDEDDARKNEENIREDFRKCQDLVNAHSVELEFMKDRYEAYFLTVDAKFTLFQDQLNKGNYVDAKDTLASIDREVNQLRNNLNVAPKYSMLATKVLPKKINDIIDAYNEMQTAEYPLYHILANSTINSVKIMLNKVVSKLQNFNYENIEDEIHNIDSNVAKLDHDLEMERTARMTFDSQSEDIYNRAEDLERDYIKYLREINELSKVYEISDDMNNLSITIKNEVNNLSIIRRTLDSLNYGKQPYSMRVEKMEELKKQVHVVEDSIDNYKKSIGGMRDNSDYAFNLVEESSYKLKNIELQIRNARHEKLRYNYVEDFNYAYSLIEKLAAVVHLIPIEVKKVNAFSKELNELVTKIEINAKNDLALIEYTEKLIMYANTYRAAFSDVSRNVSKAEAYFYDTRFTSAIEVLDDALSRFPAPPFSKPTLLESEGQK